MKRRLKQLSILLLCFAALVLVSCEDSIAVAGGGGTGDGTGNNAVLDIFVVNVSQETDWDYMVVGRDGSSIFFNVNENNNVPTRLFLRGNRNSDDGFTLLFKENGLPDKMIANGHILYFGNFRGYQFDMAIIRPNNTIDYFFDIQTHTNWNAFTEATFQGRIIGDILRSLPFLSNALGIGTCIISPFFPAAAGKCATYAVQLIGRVVLGQVFDSFTADLGSLFMYSLDCLGDGFFSAFACLNAIANMTSVLSNHDLNLVNQRITQINEAIRRIDGDGLTIIPPDLLADLLMLGIEINHGNNPPNIEGTFFVSPSILVRSNFSDGFSPGHRFADTRLTFSNQDNARMIVEIDTIQGVGIGSGINAFITGSGNRFSVFSEDIVTRPDGSSSTAVSIRSGEITPTGIFDYHRALIMTVESPHTIRRGQGRLIRDDDGFSERISLTDIESLNYAQGGRATFSEVFLPGFDAR